MLLIAFAVCSCHVKGGGEFAPEGKVFTATATVNDFVLDGASKTAFTINDNKVSFAFEDDDILRIYPLNPVGDGLRFTVKDNKGTSCEFDGGGFGLYNGKSYAAFYPGSDESVPNATEIPVDYTGQAMISKEAWDLSSVDYLVANVPALQGSCSFSMQHVGALLVLDVTFEEAGIYNELSLTSQGNPFIATGTIDLTADPIAITGTEFADTISLALGGSDGISVEAGETVRFIMMIAPVDMSNSTILMDLKNGNDVISAEIEGKNYEAGKAYKIDAGGTDTNKIEGSRRDVIVQSDFGGSGASGDDVSEGSGPSQGNEDSSKNGINYVYGNNTVAVTDAVMEKISNLTKDGFRLPADSWGNSSIGHGDVFVFPQSELFPGGYAAKVTDITPDGDGFYYSTTLATIDEIFETLHLEQTAMDLTPYIEKVVREDGTDVEWTKTKVGFSLPIPEIFGDTDDFFDFNDNVQINPSAEINFNLDVAADIVGHRLAYARANVNTSARLSADVSIKDGPEKKWQSKRFKVIVAPIPVWPVIITPEVYVSFELKLTGEVNMTFSVNYQKAYYAYTIYDGNSVHSDAGEAAVPDKEDPFAVAEELSGSVEFGPNVGVGLSLYGGALGVSVDFNPHAACAFAGSLPFTMETWTNMGNAGMWLSNAYYEPSVLFSFGGAVDIAYIWHIEFELPDDVQLSYSFGKTFIIPKLGETLEIKASQGGQASISTTIYNKAIFDDDIFVYIRKDGPDGPILYKRPFTISRKPKFEGDEVNINTSVSGLDPGTYYVDGPYITISAFGYSRDVAMTPVQDDDRYIFIHQPQDIAFSADWAEYDVYVAAWTGAVPTLYGAKTTVTYESSNEAVATVNPSTGAVTIAAGAKKGDKAVITATAASSNQYQSATASYTIYIVNSGPTTEHDDDGRLSQHIYFSTSSAEYVYEYVEGYGWLEGWTKEVPTLSGAMTPVTYASSNEAVAIVNSTTGAITIASGVKKGDKAVITATAKQDETYREATASYTIYIIEGHWVPIDPFEL